MDIQKNKIIVSAFFISLMLFLLWGCTQKRGEDETYSGGYNPRDLITISQGDGYPDIQFPKNQLLIHTADATTRDQFLGLLDEIGGTLLIGQIPSVGIYQVQVNTKSKEELDQLKETFKGRSEVERVGYNIICTQAGSFDFSTCPVMPDNKEMYPDEADPFDTLCDYYTALEIVAGLRDSIPMGRVTIGLNEIGYNPGSGQFDDITIEDVSESGATLVPSNSHGNAVTGIICADNDGSLVNGIASSFLGDKLRVIIARPPSLDLHSHISSMYRLALHADIVLNTFFAALRPGREEFSEEFETERWFCRTFFEANPNVLFINAAPNVNMRLTNANAFPAGMRMDNTLTVGATSSESPTRMSTAYGELIDISAPGEGIWVMWGDDEAKIISHDFARVSWAVPQVASAVALLKSVGRNRLSNRELKQYLLEFSGGEGSSGPREVSGEGGIMLDYARPLTDLLWDMYQDKAWASFVMDWNEDGVHDGPSSFVFSLCETSNLEVEDVGEFTIDPENDCFGNEQVFILQEDGSAMTIYVHGYDEVNKLWGGFNISTLMPIPGFFAVNQPYPIGGEGYDLFLSYFGADTDRDSDCISDFEKEGDISILGEPIIGTFEITNCRVAERTADGEPKYLFVDLSIDCLLDLGLFEYPDEVSEFTTSARGWVRSLRVTPLPPLATFDEYIDTMCSEEAEERGETE